MGTNIRKRPILRAFLTFSICPLKCPLGDKKSGKPDITAFQRGDKICPLIFFICFLWKKGSLSENNSSVT